MFNDNNETSLAPCRVFKAHKEYLTRLLLSPDIKLLATCSADHTVKIWRIEPGEEALEVIDDDELTPQTPSRSSHSLPATFGNAMNGRPSTDSSRSSTSASPVSQASHSTGNLQATQAPLPIIVQRKPLPLETTLDNHQRWVWDCAFSADSAYLVTVSSDHYARLWELQSSQVIRQYSGHHRGAVCVALNDYSGAGG